MTEVNNRVLETVKSIVEAEVSTRQATALATNAAKSATQETERATKAAQELGKTIDLIKGQAESLEDKLTRANKSSDAQSENVRKEARLLVESIERRVNNLEQIAADLAQGSGRVGTDTIQKRVKELKEEASIERDEFVSNSRYEYPDYI